MIKSRLDRAGLVERVAERTGLSARTSEKAVDAVLEEIYEALKRGECVSLKNFGTFYVRPERESWVFKFNPRSGCGSCLAGHRPTRATCNPHNMAPPYQNAGSRTRSPCRDKNGTACRLTFQSGFGTCDIGET